MKRVCVVGAGPAGLAGAKALLQTGEFSVTIFEKGERVGGIWAVDKTSKDGLINPITPTNISRFTVGFSDLDWNVVDLRERPDRGSIDEDTPAPAAPMFPLAWQVNRYLEEFRRRYVPGSIIHLGREVIRAERAAKGSETSWRITVRDKSLRESSQEFDYLILASGFFASPRLLDYNLVERHSQAPKAPIKVIHTSQFRTIQDLIPDRDQRKGKKILIFGGGNSSGETAATLAGQLSDLKYSPLTRDRDRYEDMRIVQVTPRPLYAVPPFTPVDEDCRSFLPLDLKFYDLSKRPEGPIESNAGEVTRGFKDILHSALRSLVGGNQSDLGSDALTVPSGEPRSPIYVTLSESYSEYVRSGAVEVLPGRVAQIEYSDAGTASAMIKNGEDTYAIDEIAAVIYATGYTASTAVDFLDDQVKEALHYDRTSMRLPLVLSGYQTYAPSIPDLGFLGFYESPYWSMIEMQADLTATRWLSHQPIPSRPFEEASKLLELREAIQARRLDIPQYWFGDHLAYMEEVATHLKRTRHHGAFAPREGPVPSARYHSRYTNTEQAKAIMSDLHSTWIACTVQGKYVARAAFRAVQGDWAIQRTIASALSSFPSGTLTGTASFHPRRPTPDKSGKHFDLEYLYIESGVLVLSNGASMPATRRYVYRYSEARDELSVWFVKPDSDLEVDYLFHDLTFILPDEAKKVGACVAKADHLCVEDMYWTEYRLPIQGIALHEFEAKHTVKGPSKDYVAMTVYRRPEKTRGIAR